VTLLLALIVAPFTLLTFCFAVELFAGIRPLRRAAAKSTGATAVIVVPAHNEEAAIGSRLGPLVDAASGLARILVVADNCTDGTAATARRLGVDVIERVDRDRRGKGYALDFARQHLRSNSPDVVLIVDADCVIDSESVQRLIACCVEHRRPCQAVNLLYPVREGSPAVQLSTFAFFIKNVIRQRALQRIAGRVHLLGTGMALPWLVFGSAELATADIVEDLKMGVELAEAGHAPMLVEGATIWSEPETERNTLSQRRRWEGGFLQNALRNGPRMLAASLRRADLRGLWSAINLVVPPLALLVLLDLAALAVGALLVGSTTAASWPLLLMAGSLALACGGLLLAWLAGGSRFVTLGGLARVPLYLAWKLPLYLGLARSGAPKHWLRTRGEP
jgi:cellulose synthase/poly-beta-1,6-N-acetylglucosamine synthase-like glycosyltransferase